MIYRGYSQKEAKRITVCLTIPFLTISFSSRRNCPWKRNGYDCIKDVASAPWYHLFNGDRINDHHLTLAEKRAAREAKST
jgi:hypothetical protein